MSEFDQIKELRNLRNILLQECDWTQFADNSLSSEVKASWATYRQALRDLPANVDLEHLSPDLHEVIWPSKP